MSNNTEFNKLETFNMLEQAFLAEAKMSFRYSYFATIADFEGKQEIAELFRELAVGGEQTVAGSMDFLKLGKDSLTEITPGTTIQNLKMMMETEEELSKNKYPQMEKIANSEGATDIASWFCTLKHSKRHHAERLMALNRNE